MDFGSVGSAQAAASTRGGALPVPGAVEASAGYRVEVLPWDEHVDLRPAYRRSRQATPGPGTFGRAPERGGRP